MIAELSQFALDSIETLTWILFGKSHRQVDDLLSGSRPAGLLFFALRIAPLHSDQCSMPSKESSWCEQCAEFFEQFAPESFAANSEFPPLIIVE